MSVLKHNEQTGFDRFELHHTLERGVRQAGFEKVASVAGGLLRWKDEGLPLAT